MYVVYTWYSSFFSVQRWVSRVSLLLIEVGCVLGFVGGGGVVRSLREGAGGGAASGEIICVMPSKRRFATALLG